MEYIDQTVTFGGTGYDRAAKLRVRAEELSRGIDARTIVLWRGKVLVENDALVLLSIGHDALENATMHIFMGTPADVPLFATDISTWAPDEADAAAAGGLFDQSEQRHPQLKPTQIFADLRAVMTRLSPLDAELAATAKAMIGWHETHRFCSRCGHASDIAMGGWQRNCPACKGQHFPRTDPVVIMAISDGDNLLVARSPAWPPGMYSLPAGFVEPGETIEAAVRREVLEETGITVGAVTYDSAQPWPFPASLMFGCRGTALSRDIAIDPDEIEDAFWISRADLGKVFAAEHPRMNPPRKGAIAHFIMSKWLEAAR